MYKGAGSLVIAVGFVPGNPFKIDQVRCILINLCHMCVYICVCTCIYIHLYLLNISDSLVIAVGFVPGNSLKMDQVRSLSLYK